LARKEEPCHRWAIPLSRRGLQRLPGWECCEIVLVSVGGDVLANGKDEGR
jgi:hypothetical protein